MQGNTIFKYYVMGSDPGVSMQSSIYPENNMHVHIIGNMNNGAEMIASKIDEIIQERYFNSDHDEYWLWKRKIH
ncbi:hypothetical protein D3C74_478300 [compost metagenome]